MELLINIIVAFLIALVAWFFLMKKEPRAVKAAIKIKVVVKGGYDPAVIEVKVGQPITFAFDRQDPSSCLEEVVFPDFKIRHFLPLNQITEITLKPEEVGEYQFHCGMSMYFGKLKVVEYD